jgi:uncharacterized protein DUF4136
MRAVRLGFFLGLALLVSACARTPPVPNYDYDPAANFSALHTYDWQAGGSSVQDHDPRLENALFDRRLREIVDRQMPLKGFRQDTSRPPDFFAAYHLLIEKRTHGYAPYPYYGYGAPYFSPWWRSGFGWYGMGGWDGQDVYWREYESVTLLLDFLDPASGRLIWRGTARNVVDFAQSPVEQAEELQAAVRFLLTRFPP